MSELVSAIQEEAARRRARVAECRAALAQAEAEEKAFQAEIGQAVGLRLPSKPGRRHAQASSNGEAGSDDAEAGEKDDAADAPTARAETKQERVLALYLEGNTIVDIAEQLGISRASVDTHLSTLRKKGLLQPTKGEPQEEAAETEADPEPETEAEEKEEAPADEDDAEDGSSIADLKAEVLRQQDGKKSKPVFLRTAISRGHVHEAIVDHFGDGHTTTDGSGHVHRVYRFVLSTAHSHSHDLRVVKS